MALAAAAPKPRVFTPLLLTCFGISALGSIPVYMLYTQLPVHVLSLGGTRMQVGMLVSALTLVAMVVRPVVGAWTDRYGARRVMLPGVVPLLVASLAFHVAASPAVFIVLMALVGLSIGSITTASGALVARATTPAHRAEILIVYTVFTHVPTALGPVLGSALSALGGVELNFVFITALALVTGVLIWLLPRLPPEGRERGGGRLAFLRPRVRLAVPIVVMNLVGYASMFPFLPLHARARGFGGIGWFFLLYSTLMVVSRLCLRRFPDRFGRPTVITATIGLLAAAYLVMALPVTVISLVTAAVLLAVGVSCYHPTLLAWVLDRTPEAEHGRVMGTIQASTDLGMAVGSAVTGFVVQRTMSYGVGFACAGGVALAALLTFAAVAAWLERPHPPRPGASV